jgi:hypothetical protein
MRSFNVSGILVSLFGRMNVCKLLFECIRCAIMAADVDNLPEHQKRYRWHANNKAKLNSGHRTKKVCVATKKPRVALNRIICRTKEVEKNQVRIKFLTNELAMTKRGLSIAMEKIKQLEVRVKELEGSAAKDDGLKGATAVGGVVGCKRPRANTVSAIAHTTNSNKFAGGNKSFMLKNADVLGFTKKGFTCQIPEEMKELFRQLGKRSGRISGRRSWVGLGLVFMGRQQNPTTETFKK